MHWLLRDRWLNASGAFICLFAIAFAVFWLQFHLGYEPCPLCVLDRGIFALAAVLFALAAIHNPEPTGRRVYAGLTSIVLLIGVAVGIRHLYLQSLPPELVPACGPTLGYLLDTFPVMEALSIILRGAGSCAEIHGVFLGLSIPAWTLLAFAVVTALAVFLLLRPAR